MSSLVHADKRFAQLTVDELYAILRLRSEVFVVEQQCAYQELDGRDREPGTRHLWLSDPSAGSDDTIAAYLRVLVDSDAARIGRVVTDPRWRGQGLAAELMATVVATTVGPLVLDAQAHLEAWYSRFGFVAVGDRFVEDAIPHLPMRLERDTP